MEIVLGVTLSLLAGVIPTVLYAAVLWWFDRYEKEPLWLLGVTFLWGAIPAIILALMAELILGIPVSVLGDGLWTDVVESGGVAPVVEEIALFLEENPLVVIEVGGHTNDIPPHEFCDKLSTERAKSVAEYIVDQGVDPGRVVYKGYGTRQPKYANNTEDGRRRE